MLDEKLIESFAVQEVFCDGFCDFHVSDGVLRCVGYRTQPTPRLNGEEVKVAVVRIVMPIAGAEAAADQTKKAVLTPVRGFAIANAGKCVN